MNLKLKSLDLSRAAPWQRPVLLLATGFGLGLAPIASGTFGTLPGVLIVLGMHAAGLGSLAAQSVVAIVLATLAVPVCDVAERHFGRKDDGRIVADEFMTFPVCMLGLPPEPWVLAMAFILNRFLDVVKPPPARQLQVLRGGYGIVADDFCSCLYGLIANHLLYGMLASHFSIALH